MAVALSKTKTEVERYILLIAWTLPQYFSAAADVLYRDANAYLQIQMCKYAHFSIVCKGKY